PEHVEAAHAAVAAAQLSGLPDDVRAAVTALGERYGGPVFLAAMSGRHGVVVSADGTIREVDRLVTAMLTAEVGGGVLSSQLIEETADGRKPTAAAFSGGVGFELGVSYFLLDVGLDATVTPGRTVAFARAGGDGNAVVSVHPQPHAGLGAYILRPVSDTPTLSIAADVMWSGPAHMVYGGRIAVGVPLDARHNWLRIVAGGGYGPQTLWKLPDDPIREIVGFLRVGLGARL
ncbi:MAG TPA: hypothetical protein PKA64_24085, partial [Myxococcota bacterium]|nr:hypothetical protein [Myxococcota bacterium]